MHLFQIAAVYEYIGVFDIFSVISSFIRIKSVRIVADRGFSAVRIVHVQAERLHARSFVYHDGIGAKLVIVAIDRYDDARIRRSLR